METPAVQYAWNDDISLAYQVFGEGPVDILFLPGWFANVEVQWESPYLARFLEGLAQLGRVIAMDRRGWGLSDRFSPRAVEPLETLTDDIAVVLDAAGSDRAVVIASFESSMIAQFFAAATPDRVSGLVLIDPIVSPTRSDRTPWMPDRGWWERAFEPYGAEWGRTFGTSIIAPYGADEVQWHLRMQRFTAAPGVMVAEARRYVDISTADVLPAIHVPTIVLTDAPHSDPWEGSWEATGRYIASQVRGASHFAFEGDEHFWYQPAELVLSQVGALIDSLGVEEDVRNRVLATVLFTDIVDSTANAAAIGDRRWRELREQHDAVVRRYLSRYRGREVKTMGDGFLVTFDGPARAVRCAQAIVADADGIGVQVRAGIHTGEIELDGGDITGIAVAIGARVGALASPCEVLVSRTVRDLTAGSGIDYADRGEHELKGVPDSWRLFAAT